ncbi:MAG: DUF4129 domain-containing protein [Actinomycetes bacterium]
MTPGRRLVVVITGLALLVLALGARQRLVLDPTRARIGPFIGPLATIAGILLAVVGAALLVLMLARHPAPEEDVQESSPVRRGRGPALAGIFVAVVIITLLVIVGGHHPFNGLGSRPVPGPGARVKPLGGRVPPLPPSSLTPREWQALAAVGLLLLLAVAALLVRSRYARGGSGPRAASAEADLADLAEAARSGAVLLDEIVDPRAAVLACYAAMEARLAQAGTGPHAADTPAELLERVRAARSASEGPVAELTGLFVEARFSPHPVDEAARARARAVLAVLAGTGRTREADQPAGLGPSGAPVSG